MKAISTLEMMDQQIGYKPLRRSGNTTRLIDCAIQIIFSGDKCIVMDHHEGGINKKSNERLFVAIMNRIESEHHYLIHNRFIRINKFDTYQYQFVISITLLDKPDKPTTIKGSGVTIDTFFK